MARKKARSAAAKKKKAAAPKTPTESKTGSSKMARSVHKKYVHTLAQEIRTALRPLEKMYQDSGGKHRSAEAKKAYKDFFSEYEAFKKTTGDKGTIDKLSQELIKKIDTETVAARHHMSALRLKRSKQAGDDLRAIDAKAVADAEAKQAQAKPAPGGVDPEAAADAKAEVVEERTATKGERKKYAPKQDTFGPEKGRMRAGLVKAYAEAHPDALKAAKELAKRAGFKYADQSLASQLHYLVEAEGGGATGKAKMLKWVKSTKGGTVATTPAATTPPPASEPATVLDPDAVESAKAATKHVSRRDMATTLKFVSEKTGRSVASLKKAAAKAKGADKKYLASLLTPEQLAELNPKPGETRAKPPSSPKTRRSGFPGTGKGKTWWPDADPLDTAPGADRRAMIRGTFRDEMGPELGDKKYEEWKKPAAKQDAERRAELKAEDDALDRKEKLARKKERAKLDAKIAESKTPKAMREQADALEAHAKNRLQGKNAQGRPARILEEPGGFSSSRNNKEMAARMLADAKDLRERAAEAESGKPKPKAKPLTDRQKANLAAREEAARRFVAEEPGRIAAHAKKKARAQASRQRIANQASVYTEGGVADAEEVRTLKGQRRVDKEAALKAQLEEEGRAKWQEPTERQEKRAKKKQAKAEAQAEKGKGKGKWQEPEYKPKDPTAGKALEKSKTPHKGKVRAAVAQSLGIDNVDELLGADWNWDDLAKYMDDATRTGSKASRLAGHGAKAAKLVSQVAGAIPPGAARVLGGVLRYAGPAGTVYEAARMGYNISEKGLVEALRDEESSWMTGVDRGKLDAGLRAADKRARVRAIATKAATTPGTKDTSEWARKRKAKLAEEGKQKASIKTGSAGKYNISRKSEAGLAESARTGHVPAEFRKKGKRYKGSRTKGEIDAAARQRAIARDKAKNLPFLKRVLKRRGEASREKAASDYERRVTRESLRGTEPTRAERKEAARNEAEAAIKRMRQRRGDLEQEKVERVLSAERSALYPKAAVMQSFKDAAERARKEQVAKRIDAETKKKQKAMGLL